MKQARAFTPTCTLDLLKPSYKRAEAGPRTHLAAGFFLLVFFFHTLGGWTRHKGVLYGVHLLM